jgi:MFS family permease
MAANTEAATPDAPATADPGGGGQPWPQTALAWYAVVILALVLMLGQLESQIINYLIKPIKRDFHLSDLQMSVLIGVAPSAFYALVGFPLARLVDSMRRTAVMSVALGLAGVMTSMAGFTQAFWQFALCRFAVGGGGAVSNPGTYSLLSDYFPRERLPRAIATLTLGLVFARAIAPILSGTMVGLAAGWGVLHLGGLAIREWQTVFIMAGALGLTGAILMLTVREPARRGRMSALQGKPLPMRTVFAYVWTNRLIYLPQYLALGFYAVESFGLESWRLEFLRRTYGWEPQVAGPILGTAALCAQLTGLFFGTRLTEWLAKRTDDANLRTVAIAYTIAPIFAVASPLMPTPWLSIACSAASGMLGTACAAPQNAALQSVTPNEMRGQITALYYFVFTAIGLGIGPTIMAFVTNVIIGDETLIRYAMAGSAAVMTPLAAIFMWIAVGPYGRAIAAIKARESQ